jgi:transcriptional regulator with XRE-family HTH domain
MSDLKQQTGMRIRLIRKEKKLSQRLLAEKVGLSPNMVGYIERGERFASADTFDKLSKVLNVPVREFFNFEKPSMELEPEKAILMKRLADLLSGAPVTTLKVAIRVVEGVKNLGKLKNENGRRSDSHEGRLSHQEPVSG